MSEVVEKIRGRHAHGLYSSIALEDLGILLGEIDRMRGDAPQEGTQEEEPQRGTPYMRAKIEGGMVQLVLNGNGEEALQMLAVLSYDVAESLEIPVEVLLSAVYRTASSAAAAKVSEGQS